MATAEFVVSKRKTRVSLSLSWSPGLHGRLTLVLTLALRPWARGLICLPSLGIILKLVSLTRLPALRFSCSDSDSNPPPGLLAFLSGLGA